MCSKHTRCPCPIQSSQVPQEGQTSSHSTKKREDAEVKNRPPGHTAGWGKSGDPPEVFSEFWALPLPHPEVSDRQQSRA